MADKVLRVDSADFDPVDFELGDRLNIPHVGQVFGS